MRFWKNKTMLFLPLARALWLVVGAMGLAVRASIALAVVMYVFYITSTIEGSDGGRSGAGVREISRSSLRHRLDLNADGVEGTGTLATIPLHIPPGTYGGPVSPDPLPSVLG